MEPRYKMCELCLTTAVLYKPGHGYCSQCTADIAEDFFDLDEDEIDWEPIDEQGSDEVGDKFDWSTFDDLND